MEEDLNKPMTDYPCLRGLIPQQSLSHYLLGQSLEGEVNDYLKELYS